MQLTTFLLPTLLAATAAAAAVPSAQASTRSVGDAPEGNVTVINNCADFIYVTSTKEDKPSLTWAVGAGYNYTEPIIERGGVQFGVQTNNRDYSFWDPRTPKLVWGFAKEGDDFYYSLSVLDNNPSLSQKIRLRTNDPKNCPAVETPDAKIRTCSAYLNYELVVCAS